MSFKIGFALVFGVLVMVNMVRCATKCHRCDNFENGESCGVKLQLTNVSIPTKDENYYCYKFVVLSGSNAYIERGIFATKCVNKHNYITSSGYTGSLYCCTGDDCNGSKLLESNIITLVVTIILSWVFFK